MSLSLDDIKKLHQKKYRAEFGHFLVEGEHLVLELQKAALQQIALKDCTLFVTQAYQHWPSEFKKTLVSDKQMAQLSDTKSPQGIIALVPFLPAKPPSVKPTRAIYLHEIQDPGNLGTILRTLAWFGNFRLLLSPNSVDPYNPKVVRASMGAIFHVPMELDVALESLNFPKIACLDIQGSPLTTPSFKDYDCYLFGNEARGVPHESLNSLTTTAFTIPGGNNIESLNLATAVNICAYELIR